VNHRFRLLAFGAILASSSCVAGAEEKPLWEAGLGVGALMFPDYRGSDETRVFPVPIPYFVYRGDFLKADRDGVRGELFNREAVEASVSVSGTIPVSSDDNDARRGMPDLKPTIELGPSIDLHVWKSASGDTRLDVVLPVRVPITLESSPRSLGWVFSPRINVDIDDVAGFKGWTFGAGTGPIFADERFHDYFYSVDPSYATAARPEYQARGGYSGAHFLFSLSKRFETYWVGAYMRYDVLSNAEFADSPLMRRSSYLAGGFGVAWMIGESKRKVESDD
jgi:outer membrane protein